MSFLICPQKKKNILIEWSFLNKSYDYKKLIERDT